MLVLYVLKNGVMSVLSRVSSMHKMFFILAQFQLCTKEVKKTFKTIKNNKDHEKDNLEL
jgi:hypothetical protein